MSVDFTSQLFTRKQMLFMIWQVFWLTPLLKPSRLALGEIVAWRFNNK